MLSLTRAPGEEIDLFIDYHKNDRLVAYIQSLGGNPEDLEEFSDRIVLQYVAPSHRRSGKVMAAGEVTLALKAPGHVEIWRSELLAK